MSKATTELSIIIPTLNEAYSIRGSLESLARLNGNPEVIIVDGGSSDRTCEIAREYGAQVIASKLGRGVQMHTGASAARGEAFWFLHADTIVPGDGADQIKKVLTEDLCTVGGNFAVRFDGVSRGARFMTWLYPKLRKLGLCYGDSGIFVRASAYEQVGGFKPFPIFEDLDLMRVLQKRGKMAHLPAAVITSSRRFEGKSFVLTFARWSILQGLYWLGISPHVLSEFYAPARNETARGRVSKKDRGEKSFSERHKA